MGFGSEVQEKIEEHAELFRHVEPEDLMKFGLIPELIGRMPVVAPLEPLSDTAMRSILTTPKNALVKQYQKLMAMEGVELEFRDDAIGEIISRAKLRKTGARALRGVVEEAMLDVMYNLPDRQHLKKVVVTADTVTRTGEPIYLYGEEKQRKTGMG